MIALRDNFPLVRFDDGSVMNYDQIGRAHV